MGDWTTVGAGEHTRLKRSPFDGMTQAEIGPYVARYLVCGLCHCGRGDARTFLRAMLEWVDAVHDEAREAHVDGEAASDGWVEFVSQLLAAGGLLDHGSSIGGAWLSAEGKRVLAWLRAGGEYFTDDDCPCGHTAAEHETVDVDWVGAPPCGVLGCVGACPPARGMSYADWLDSQGG